MTPHQPQQTQHSEGPDAFDRLYLTWAEQAVSQGLNPPSSERWDAIVLRLIMSEDPDRVARYKHIEAIGEETLGGDAFDLWRKTPDDTPNLSVPLKAKAALHAYASTHMGAMQRLMQSQGLGERYDTIMREYDVYMAERKARARRGQQSVLIIGCAGMGAILLMMLTVVLIIALRWNG